jgi:hypothetical protein
VQCLFGMIDGAGKRQFLDRISSTFSRLPWDQMKKHHYAAALVLIVWYLILPPIKLEPNPHFNFGAPLSQWFIESNYDSTTTCELGRAALMARMQGARCVAAEDPRLTK